MSATASPPAIACPMRYTPMGRPRLAGANMSLIIDTAHGARVASPRPTSRRETNIHPKLGAKAPMIVARLQMLTPAMIRSRRWTRSATSPRGTPTVA